MWYCRVSKKIGRDKARWRDDDKLIGKEKSDTWSQKNTSYFIIDAKTFLWTNLKKVGSGIPESMKQRSIVCLIFAHPSHLSGGRRLLSLKFK